jgi:teichuronic acid biosynthesis glycosyltransferase TuaC
MKVLTLATVFPNPAQPMLGPFVFERIRHAAQHADVRVVAPIAWFRRPKGVPASSSQSGLKIEHPTFFYVPAVLKFLNGVALFLSILPRVNHLRREFNFDLVDAHFAIPDGVAAILLGCWFRRPVVITLRGFEHQFVEYRLRRTMMRWALRRATRVIAVSAPLAALAQRLGVAPERIEVIENGVDTDRFRPMDAAEARRLVSIDRDKRVLISVGHLVPLKGFHRIIAALPELREEFPNLSLVIVGGSTSAKYVQDLQQLVGELGLSSHVIFTGSLPTDRVAEWLNASNLFVLCSDREGCPNVVWEAMACGRPVVSPKVGAVEQMVPAEAGILFDTPSDGRALIRSVSLALNTQWDSRRIREHAEAHTWASVASRVLRQWRLAVDGPTGVVDPAVTTESSIERPLSGDRP